VLSQGTLYLSNLGEPSTSFIISPFFEGVADQSFETRSGGNGYLLNSVSLLMGDIYGSASNLNVSIYSDNSGQAGSSVGNLIGNNDPKTAGQYIYTASGIILNPSTTYWIVTTCDQVVTENFPNPPIIGGYTRQSTASTTYLSEDGWNIASSSIPIFGFSYLFQFSINATPIPEPAFFYILAISWALLCLRRANR
jgi:hypothetical protein